MITLAGPGLAMMGAFAPGAMAQTAEARCAVTEVAPGVKMRAQNCPMFYARPAGQATTNELPSAVMNGPPQANSFRFGNTELRVQGRVRGEMGVQR